VPAVLDGVRDLLSERWAEDAVLVGACATGCGPRACSQQAGRRQGRATDPEVAKFRDYFDYDEPIRSVPSHRALAVFRGRTLGAGRQAGARRGARPGQPSLAEMRIAPPGLEPPAAPGDDADPQDRGLDLEGQAVLSLERDLFARLREAAEATAIKVFADNLRDLLLAAPAGRAW
jgi:uncharacterized protein